AGANAAVALPQDELRAGPALEIAEIAHDEVGDGLDVVVDAPEVLAFRLADRARETGADRVDHHQVRAIEEAEFVVDDPERTAGIGAEIFERRAARAEDAHVQPGRSRAGTAVVREHDRPGAGVL